MVNESAPLSNLDTLVKSTKAMKEEANYWRLKNKRCFGCGTKKDKWKAVKPYNEREALTEA